LHGFPDFSWGWRHQIAALASQGFRVIAPDQRGYYLSDKPLPLYEYDLKVLVSDVLDLANAYARPSFRLVGHDWGGIIAWAVAARHPDRVTDLAILNAPHPDVWPRLGWRWRQALKSWYIGFFQLPTIPERLLRFHHCAILQAALRRSARPHTFSRSDLQTYVTAWSQPGALHGMLNYYRALRRRRGALPGPIKVPTLLVWGEQDVFLLREVALASLELCQHAQALFLPDAGHWVQLEEPVAVNDALSRFFSRELSYNPDPLARESLRPGRNDAHSDPTSLPVLSGPR
jgi:pimeloyl-ACP methyl ester carboxylesterase